jgi:hypothetical protein
MTPNQANERGPTAKAIASRSMKNVWRGPDAVNDRNVRPFSDRRQTVRRAPHATPPVRPGTE